MTPPADSSVQARLVLAPVLSPASDAGRAVSAELPAVDVCQIIESQPLNAFVVRLVIISWLVTFLDGFDLNVIAFVAPYLKSQYSLDVGALGAVFVSGSAGALLGGLLFGFLGDRFGRRRAIVAAVGLFGVLTLLLAAAGNTPQLLLARFFGGIALGGALPLIWALSIEYVPTRYRATVVTLIMLGYGLGVCISGPLSVALIPHYGWQSVFVVGGVASLGAAALVWRKLPESLRFLAHRGGDPQRIARIVRRLIPERRFEPSQLVFAPAPAVQPRGPAILFDGALRYITPLLWLAFAASSLTQYFFATWGPIVFEQMGLSRSGAAWSSSFNSLVGATGAVVLMRFTDRLGPASLAVMPILAVPLLMMIGVHHVGPTAFMAMMALVYLLLGGSHYGIQSILGIYYPTGERARGAGWAASIGKVGSIAAPLLGTWLLAYHVSRSPFVVLAAFPAVFAVAVIGIGVIARRRGLRSTH
ncbi:MAG TPA: MFS transporter [Steroidobacteraceae bacterium]|nr:MFS transporter [Steroidobacteraceae bacterium]